MPDSPDQTVQTPPPAGDPQKAERYLNTLIDLINLDRLTVTHSDLKRFDPTSLQDHYRCRLDEYEVEVSHSKAADSGKNSYVMVFSNLRILQDNPGNRIILAFTYLTEEQFAKFKKASDEQLERERIRMEERRFKEAMLPIDSALEKLLSEKFSEEKAKEEDADETAPETPTESEPSLEPVAHEDLPAEETTESLDTTPSTLADLGSQEAQPSYPETVITTPEIEDKPADPATSTS